MKMTAAVMYEQGLAAPYADSQPFRIEEVDLLGPGEGEVLVEVKAAGLCHSDLSVVGGLRKRTLPVVGGHEGAGIVREVGPGVRHLAPGDHVVMSVAGGCGACAYCVGGRPGLCDNIGTSRYQGMLPNGSVRLSRNNSPIYHYSGISCFAQYAVTVPSSLVKIEKDVPFDVAALFGCAVVTGAGAVFNAAHVRPGSSIAVVGLGGVGLNAVMAAKIAGASTIIGIDIMESKFPLANELGCTHTFLGQSPDTVEKVRDLTLGGVDYVFEFSGNRQAMLSSIHMTRKGGEIICVGLGATTDMFEYPHAQLVSEEKVIRGSLMGSGIGERDIPRFLRFYQEGRMPVEKLMSSAIGFDDLNRALDQLHGGDVVRQVLHPKG
jgi:Zn-dependent alcohol dehydrogenase